MNGASRWRRAEGRERAPSAAPGGVGGAAAATAQWGRGAGAARPMGAGGGRSRG